MKKVFTFPVFAIILIAFLSSCEKDDTVPDPAGAITISINYTVNPMSIVLFQDIDEAPDQGWPYVQIKVGIRNASMNFEFDAIQSDNINIGHPYNIHYGVGGEIANVGNVNGLGEVTNKPSSGWTNICAVEVGQGYVVRFKHSKNYVTANLPYYYARLYVVGLLTNTTGGVIGAKVKYQFPF